MTVSTKTFFTSSLAGESAVARSKMIRSLMQNSQLLLWLLPLTIVGCSDDKPTAPNQAPHIQHVWPNDRSTHAPLDLQLTWIGHDPDGDPLTYDVYFDTLFEPALVAKNQMDTTFHVSHLKRSTTYYWKVVAIDNHGQRSAGNWTPCFTTGNHLFLTGNIHTASGRIVVEGDFAYSAGWSYDLYAGTTWSGLQITDIRDPSRPSPVGYYRPTNGINSNTFCISGNFAYLSALTDPLAGGYLFQILNISDPGHPSLAWSSDSTWRASTIPAFLVGHYAYLLGGGGWQIVDVAYPSSPELAGVFELANVSGFSRAAVSEYYVYIGLSTNHLTENRLGTFDIRDPLHPILVSSSSCSVSDLAVSEDHLYAADGLMNGLLILSLADPRTPSQVGVYNATYSPIAIAVAEPYAYVTFMARDSAVLQVLDVSDHSHPKLVESYARYRDLAQPAGVAVKGSYIYFGSDFDVLHFEP